MKKEKIPTAAATDVQKRRVAARAKLLEEMKLTPIFLPGKPRTNLLAIAGQVEAVVKYFNIVEKNKNKPLFDEAGKVVTIKKVWDYGIILKGGTELRHTEPKFFNHFRKEGIDVMEKRERVPERRSL